MERALVITSRQPVRPRQLLRGRFDRKATVSLALCELQISRKISDGTNNVKFLVDIFLVYRVRDAKYVFVNKVNMESAVNNAIYSAIREAKKKDRIEEEQELENEIRGSILIQVKAMNYLEIVEYDIKVGVDGSEKKI